jgi:hypothetical protein
MGFTRTINRAAFDIAADNVGGSMIDKAVILAAGLKALIAGGKHGGDRGNQYTGGKSANSPTCQTECREHIAALRPTVVDRLSGMAVEL